MIGVSWGNFPDNCFHKIPSWILTSFDNHTKNLSQAENQPLIVNCASTKVGQEALDTYMERRGQSSCGTFVSQWREFLQMDSEAAKLLTFPYTLDSVDDEMDFVQLVTALVNFFGRAALGQIRSKFFNAFHKDEHLEWLITIPTSWNTHSRQCIREAAYKSGVVKGTDGVNLIEDPMAAALFASMCGQYDNFLAVDVGGAFMHYSGFSRNFGNMTQTLESKSLSFPTPESNFETYLTQVVSREFMLYYKAKYRPGWIELLRNFEKAKCKFDGSLTVQSSAFVFLPYSFVHEFHGYTGMQVF
ncbi:unnamed protein product [Allacma fusca]|uniref:Uncharacterized protein n=1 Tax=Allacma fusca TaxID=39272 RepID=A0A8J2K6E3_9HEXA|nr:unnamed protein product [Allacma fusca]